MKTYEIILDKAKVFHGQGTQQGFSKWVCLAGSLAQAYLHTVWLDFGHAATQNYDALIIKSHSCASYMPKHVWRSPKIIFKFLFHSQEWIYRQVRRGFDWWGIEQNGTWKFEEQYNDHGVLVITGNCSHIDLSVTATSGIWRVDI